MKNSLTAIVLAAASVCGCAATETTDSTLKLHVAPTGRLLMDGGIFTSNDSEQFKCGVDVPDIGIGILGTYGSWLARIDIGYTFGKVALKDIYIEKTFTPAHILRIGYFVHQFGLESMRGSALKVTMEEPTVSETFTNQRLLGAMYVYNNNLFHATASVHAESRAMLMPANELGGGGYGAMSRLVCRPVHESGNVLQAGISGAFSGTQYNADPELDHKVYQVGANFPTRINQVRAIDAFVTDAKSMGKFSPELLMCHDNLAFESQYFWMQVNRKHLPDFRGYGAYGMLRWLPMGGNYVYSEHGAAVAPPAGRCLELVACYNYTCLTDTEAGIRGGRLGDASLTASWHINKYLIWRLRAAYTHRFDYAAGPDINLGSLQTRLQIIF